MELAVYSLLGLAPIITVFLLLVVWQWPAKRAMPLVYLVTVAIALLVWRVPPAQVAAATIEGGITAAEILYILFGAVLLLNTALNSVHQHMSLSKAWLPYVLVGVFLIISRLPFLPVQVLLQSWELRWSNIFGTEITAVTRPLYLPATIFILVVGVTYFAHQMTLKAMQQAIGRTSQTLMGAFIATGCAVPMANVFISSGVNAADLSSIPLTLASGVAALAGQVWPVFAPAIGALGTFIAGSTTVSNMMFSLLQFGVAENIGVSEAIVVALQAGGSSAGSMFSVNNVVSVSATVGLIGREGLIIQKVFMFLLYCVVVEGILGAITQCQP